MIIILKEVFRMLSGKGQHRKRVQTNQWDSEEEGSDEIEKVQIEEASQISGNVEGEGTSSSSTSSSEIPSVELADITSLRNKSRNAYLERRQESKVLELGKEISEYDALIAKNGIHSLTSRQREDLEKKRKIYELVNEREGLNKDIVGEEYNLPLEFVDRKRKAEVLRAKPTKADTDENEKFENKKKLNRYENQWEQDQFSRAQVLGMRKGPDEIDLPNQDKYEYVFDDSQFVQYEEEARIEGDDPKENNQQQQQLKKKVELLKEVRESLPVFQFREQFLKLVKENQILIVVGETGSGKTTQLPQYLNEAGYSKNNGSKKMMIGCTQPRRVAATSVASRVAEEMGVPIGEEVGYSIRFEDNSGPKTVVKYLTDGMLLREFLTDPELSNYGALMIDEAHERTVSTEIILSLLKDILEIRKDLKLIVASATINAQKFSDFFDGAPIFKIPGRRFPVDVHYTKNPEANYIQAAITTVFQIHTTQKKELSGGDILVFLTGQDEIETMQESLEEAAIKLDCKDELIICPIYANLPPDQQQKIFEPTPPKARKIVLATNIAETSITIDGVSYVIDPGYVKENVFNPITGMESLVVVPCSRASADQRAGRAGRVGPGKCFRIYTKWSFYNELQANPTPEILRVNLTSIVLLLLSIGITDLINGFQFMDPPSPETLMKSLELLYALGALNSSGGLTKIGRIMVEFPIDCMFAKSLISSSKFGVTSEVLSIISMLGESGNLFYRPKDKREIADKRKEKFHQEEGDHFTLLDIWKSWVETGYSVQWCQDNFVQYKTLKRAKDIREQLKRLCKKVGIEEEEGEESSKKKNKTISIQKSITSGFFPNVARLSKMGDSFRTVKKNQTVYIHPSSCLFPMKPPQN